MLRSGRDHQPLASLTLSTLILGTELESPGLHVVGTIFTFSMITLWVRRSDGGHYALGAHRVHTQAIVSVPTVRGAWAGSRVVFAAPCVSDFKLSQSNESAMESLEKDEERT